MRMRQQNVVENRSLIFSNEESVNSRIAENAILQRSEKSQHNKRVFEENSALKSATLN